MATNFLPPIYHSTIIILISLYNRTIDNKCICVCYLVIACYYFALYILAILYVKLAQVKKNVQKKRQKH